MIINLPHEHDITLRDSFNNKLILIATKRDKTKSHVSLNSNFRSVEIFWKSRLQKICRYDNYFGKYIKRLYGPHGTI